MCYSEEKTKMNQKIILGHLYSTIVIIFWGLTFVSSKVLLKDFTPVEILFDRFVIATLALFLLLPKSMKLLSLKEEFYCVMVGALGITIYFLFENNALVYSNASNVCLIVSTAPLFVAIFNCFIEKKFNLGVNFFLGFVIAIAGIACLSFNSVQLKLNPIGDLLALGCAFVWGGYVYFVMKLQKCQVNNYVITVKSFFYSVILTIPCLCYWGYDLKLDAVLKPVNVINYLFLAVVASSLCFLIWNKAIDYIGSVRTNVYIYGTPVVTVIGAIFFIDERITIYTVLGMVLAISGLIISQIKPSKK